MSGPDEPSAGDITDVTSAAVFAPETLGEHLEIYHQAPQELIRLDSSPNAAAWGNTTWRGLQALAEYVRSKTQDGFRGGFHKRYHSGNELGWNPSDKKLAMSESEKVMSTAKYRSKRVLPISDEADPAVSF